MDWSFKKQDDAREQTAPLRQRRPEKFSWAFAQHFNPTRAAVAAGYERYPDRAWRRLMDMPIVQARIRALMSRRAFPDEDPRHFFTQLFDDYHCSFASTLVQDPTTGETFIDLARASEQQLALLDIDYRQTNGPNGMTRQMNIRIPSRQKRLGPIVRHLGLDQQRPEPEEDRLEAFIQQIRTAAAVPYPISTQYNRSVQRANPATGHRDAPTRDDDEEIEP